MARRARTTWIAAWTFTVLCAVRSAGGEATVRPVALEQHGSIAGRVFEVDNGLPIPVFIDPGGFALFGPVETERIIAAAVRAWQVAPLTLAIVGTGDLNAPLDLFGPTVITIGFQARMSAPAPYCDQGGFATARVGGGQPLAAYTQVFGGRGFLRQGPCTATMYYDPRDTVETCPQFQPCLFIQTLAHELGHCLGFNHVAHPAIMSDDGMPVCGCGQPTELDLEQLRQVYPLAPPIHITTPSELPFAQIGVPYAVQMQAAGGRPPYVWSVGTNGYGTPLPFPPGLTLSQDGLLSGLFAPGATGGAGLAMAVDADGNWYNDVFSVVAVDPTLQTTTTTTTTPVPTSTLVIEIGDFTCATTTTSTLPDRCDDAAGGPCVLAACRVDTISERSHDLPPAIVAKVRRLEGHVHTANALIASERPRRAAKGRRALDHALRAARQLAHALGRKRIARRIAPALLADIEGRLARVVDGLHACAGSVARAT